MLTGLRRIWESSGQTERIVCREWHDGFPPSYGAQVYSRGWRWADSNEEYRRVLIGVARWLDQQARDREEEAT